LPHGRDDEPRSELQPIVLSADAQTSDGFDCAFLLDGSELEISDKTQRCLIFIDGRSETSTKSARQKWKALSDAGENISYWQQDDMGRWTKKA